MNDRVKTEIKNGIAYVTLNRPDAMNGLDLDMFQAIIAAGKALKKDRSVRIVIMQGAGEAFCAGLDFKYFGKNQAKMMTRFAKLPLHSRNMYQEVAWVWRELPVPVIACVHGHCYGGGIQLALAADFRIATPDVKMSVMEAKWGLIPDMSGSVTLRELVSIDVAKELTMTGRIFSGAEAKEMNLVTKLSDNPLVDAEKLAAEIMTRSPDAVGAAKALFQRTWEASEDKAFSVESRLQLRMFTTKNQGISVKAGMKGEKPKFVDRQFG